MNWLKTLVSPKERLGRKGFFLVFLSAILSIFVFAFIAEIQWQLYNCEPYGRYPLGYPNLKFNVNLLFCEIAGWFCIITGIVPLSVFLLLIYALCTFCWGPNIGYGYFLESIMIAVFYALYIIQCIRRCHDMGRKWWFCLIPFYNPFVLLIGKSAPQRNEEGNR